jgi:hypothetical protein
VGSVLEYGSVCYSGMSRTHNATIGEGSVSRNKDSSGAHIFDIAPLVERFLYLNFRYLVAVFYRFDHPLKRRLETLRELNLGRCDS